MSCLMQDWSLVPAVTMEGIRRNNGGLYEQSMNMKRKCVTLFGPACWQANRKAADINKSHFYPSKCCLELWQHLNALLLFTVGPRAPGVHSEPQFHNNKQSHFGARVKPGTQHASQCEHPTITYRSVLLRSNHLSSQVLLLRGRCSVTCVSVPAGWLECHTSNLGDAVEGNTMCLQPTLVSRQDATPGPGWVQQCVVLCGVDGQKWKCLLL